MSSDPLKGDNCVLLPLPAMNFEGTPIKGKDGIGRMTEEEQEEYDAHKEDLRRLGLVGSDGGDPDDYLPLPRTS